MLAERTYIKRIINIECMERDKECKRETERVRERQRETERDRDE